MTFRSIAATFLTSLCTCSFAFGADDAPAIPFLMFPESVERAMMGEAAVMKQMYGPMQESSTVTDQKIEWTLEGSVGSITLGPESFPPGPKYVPLHNRLFRFHRCWHWQRRGR
jgi:hypothetical protein